MKTIAVYLANTKFVKLNRMNRISYSLISGLMLIMVLTLFSGTVKPEAAKRDYYQVTVYHYSGEEQEKMLDDYLGNAYLPAMHRLGINYVGVFKAHANDTSANKRLYVLLPLHSLNMLTEIPEKLDADQVYQQAGAAYIKAPVDDPPYSRLENIILRAFPLAPELKLPVLTGPRDERVYELRSYESATEEKFRNKVRMFNEGDEIGLFSRLKFNAVFYGEVLSGSRMPNLMYMTCHENKISRERNWKNFFDDPYWKKLSAMPEYQKNVSHADIDFLYPANYSDF